MGNVPVEVGGVRGEERPEPSGTLNQDIGDCSQGGLL